MHGNVIITQVTGLKKWWENVIRRYQSGLAAHNLFFFFFALCFYACNYVAAGWMNVLSCMAKNWASNHWKVQLPNSEKDQYYLKIFTSKKVPKTRAELEDLQTNIMKWTTVTRNMQINTEKIYIIKIRVTYLPWPNCQLIIYHGDCLKTHGMQHFLITAKNEEATEHL